MAVGKAGEEAAAAFLAQQGYRLLARNVRYRFGEIDMVAEDGRYLVFVEVKTRTGPGFGAPAEAVTARKQQQLVRLASLYLASISGAERLCRFDVVTVVPAADGAWSCSLIRAAFGL